MSTALLEQLITKLDNEITAINTDIKAKEAELKEERRGENNQGIIDDLRESIAALRTKEGKLIDSRDKLQHDIATQSNQGKFTYCQQCRVSLCHYVNRFPNTLSSLCQSVC
jgi:Skp family chaperone for outer membrane proteins